MKILKKKKNLFVLNIIENIKFIKYVKTFAVYSGIRTKTLILKINYIIL